MIDLINNWFWLAGIFNVIAWVYIIFWIGVGK